MGTTNTAPHHQGRQVLHARAPTLPPRSEHHPGGSTHHHAVRTDPEQPPTPGEMETMALHSRQARCLLQGHQRPLEGRRRTTAEPHGTQKQEEGPRVPGRHVNPSRSQSTVAHTALGIKGSAWVRAAPWTPHLWPWWDTREEPRTRTARPPHHAPTSPRLSVV